MRATRRYSVRASSPAMVTTPSAFLRNHRAPVVSTASTGTAAYSQPLRASASSQPATVFHQSAFSVNAMAPASAVTGPSANGTSANSAPPRVHTYVGSLTTHAPSEFFWRQMTAYSVFGAMASAPAPAAMPLEKRPAASVTHGKTVALSTSASSSSANHTVSPDAFTASGSKAPFTQRPMAYWVPAVT